MRNDIAILVPTFNRHDFTLLMMKSLAEITNFNLPKIIILDNSTKYFFPDSNFEYITVLDNRNYKHTKNYNQPSKNHCASLNWALSQITKTKYIIICDNDILFKESFLSLLNDIDNYDIIGEIGWDKVPPNRLYPYLCIVNMDFYRKNNLKYFDENRCMINNGRMDTGCSFLEDAIKFNPKIKRIRISNFIIHLKGGTLKDKHTNDLLLKKMNNS